MKNVIAKAIKTSMLWEICNNIKLLYRFINARSYEVVEALGTFRDEKWYQAFKLSRGNFQHNRDNNMRENFNNMLGRCTCS